jgi:hypothetical protein
MTSLQYDLFAQGDALLLIEIQQVKKSKDKLRKATYATMGELAKQIAYLSEVNEQLKADIERIENLLLKAKE